MSRFCKTVIVLINYLLWASSHSHTSTKKTTHSHISGVLVLTLVFPPWSQLFFSSQCWFHFTTLILLICFTRVSSSVILCLIFSLPPSHSGKCMSHFAVFEFSDYFRCVWFTSLDVICKASNLGQHLHSLPCVLCFFLLFVSSGMQSFHC